MLACQYNQPKRPGNLDLWPFDLEISVRVTCDVGYLCANFSLPRPLCSRLRPDVHNRQTDRQSDRRQHHRLMPPPRGRGHNKLPLVESVAVRMRVYSADISIGQVWFSSHLTHMSYSVKFFICYIGNPVLLACPLFCKFCDLGEFHKNNGSRIYIWAAIN